VKELLEIDVIGLKYPGHIATAVKFNDSVKGESIDYQGETYTICDPTYINAQVGIAMPEYKNINPEGIIKLNRDTQNR